MPNDKPTPIQREYTDAVSALLLQARQSTKNELATRRTQRRERLQKFWAEEESALQEIVWECIQDEYPTDQGDPLANVRKELCRCQADTRDGFRAWAVKMIAQQDHFHLVENALKQFDSHVSNFIDDVLLRQERHISFPEHEKVGDLIHLNMGTKDKPIIWTIPAELWGFVQRAWPVHLKKQRDGSQFIVKKIHGVTVSVHRLILNCELGDTVQSTSHNFLDWTSLYVRPFNSNKIYDGKNAGPAQAQFENRFMRMSVLENAEAVLEETGVYSLPVPVNADWRAGTPAGIVRVGWAESLTSAEQNNYSPEQYHESIAEAAKRLAANKPPEYRKMQIEKALAAKELDDLGL